LILILLQISIRTAVKRVILETLQLSTELTIINYDT